MSEDSKRPVNHSPGGGHLEPRLVAESVES